METSRQKVVDLALSWEGLKESDGSFKSIIDIYNSYDGTFPRGVKMNYNWAWCACTWSALAIKLGYTHIMPIEISCGHLIERAKEMECWVEEDGFVPQPGDAILYDWDDKHLNDNTGWPDHVGVVVEVYKDAGYMVVLEGNYSNSVKKRTLSINGGFIRGFITPKYDVDTYSVKATPLGGKDPKIVAREVIAGTWGAGINRKDSLEAAGYDYDEIQSIVNDILNGSADRPSNNTNHTGVVQRSVTASCHAKAFNPLVAGCYKTKADLYCRNDAGTNKKALCCIPKNTLVKNFGYFNVTNGVKWLYVQVLLDGVRYTGFCSSAYLEKQ